jgi:hypothetical protein
MITLRTPRILFVLLCLLGISAMQSAFGGVARYVDNDGTIIFSNVPVHIAPRRSEPEPQPQPQPQPRPMPSHNGKSLSFGDDQSELSTASFPKVTSAMQRQRDNDRMRILFDELIQEKAMLANATAKQDRELIRLYSTNVTALQRELDRGR